ncbi:MAG: abortive infection family protein [Candidatus Eisenbacteria bacterium]
MRKRIPAHIVAVVADAISLSETHASMDNLFMYAGAPGDPPEGSKPVKAQAWLFRLNADEAVNPIEILGRLVEGYMEVDLDDPHLPQGWRDRRQKIERALLRSELSYATGGRIAGLVGTPSRTLGELIEDRDLAAIELEFERALRSVESDPREAVSAACNILESVCKVFIEEEFLDMPKKQDLKPVWDVVRRNLGFDAGSVEDRDLKEILSGLGAVVGGIAALRTHASSAHGSAKKLYRLEPRHARLAVHSAHTIVAFILESWDKRRAV